MSIGTAVDFLDRAKALRFAADLVALDKAMLDEFGPAYSHLEWSAEHFLKEIPGKWELSQVALLADGTLGGFWIASSASSDAHTHRVAVAKAIRREQVGSNLFEAVVNAAKRLGHKRITLTVNRLNVIAHRFYERLGFVRLRSGELEAFVKDRGRTGKVIDDEIEETQDGIANRYWAWAFQLEELCD